jgi:hypothetical protein
LPTAGKDLSLLDPILSLDATGEAQRSADALYVLRPPRRYVRETTDTEVIELGPNHSVDCADPGEVIRRRGGRGIG